jgi:ribosomal protein S18 acetylase RimI-like enzyme
MWRLYFTLSAEGRKRYFDEVLPLLHDTKAQVLGDRDREAWYLVFLGTKPNSQGRGYGKRLVEDGMRRVSSISCLVNVGKEIEGVCLLSPLLCILRKLG